MSFPSRRLPPLSIEQRLDIALKAVYFFSINDTPKICAIIGKEMPPGHFIPFTVMDFLTYLEKTGLPSIRNYGYFVGGLCDALKRAGVLAFSGIRGPAIMGESYLLIGNGTRMQRAGILWLGAALGPELLYGTLAPTVPMITGISKDGNASVGSGIVISDHLILTCAHVLNDMTVDAQQTVNGMQVTIKKIWPHSTVDLGLVEVHETLSPVPGLSFRDPVISEPVFNLGYPRLTCTRSAALLMQRGEVTATDVQLLFGQEVFLYSAIARPGNSGGPIVSESGHIVGIVTQELSNTAVSSAGGEAQGALHSMPFYAGIPASVIKVAVNELLPDFAFPYETYED